MAYPPSAFPCLTPATPRTPKFVFFTAASLSASGLDVHPLMLHPSLDHLIHPFIAPGATYNQALANSIVSTITTELAARNLYTGRGESATRTSSASFYIQGLTTRSTSQYIRNNALDLLSTSPSPWGPGNGASYTPFQHNGIAATSTFSELVAARLLSQCNSLGLCYPLYHHDDDEGPDQAGLTLFCANALKFDTAGVWPGWWSYALSDPRYANSSYPVAYIPNASGTLIPFTLAQYVAAYPPPSYSASLYWSHLTNQPFINWCWQLTQSIASTSHYRGPHSGYISRFPEMHTSNYEFGTGSGFGLHLDSGLPTFGGTNDYSFLRLGPCPSFLQTYVTYNRFYASTYNRYRAPSESLQDYYLRSIAHHSLACTPSHPLYPRHVTMEILTPGQTVTIYTGTGTNGSFTMTKGLFVSCCIAACQAGVDTFIIFDSSQPISTTRLDDLLSCIREIHAYSQSGYIPFSNMKRHNLAPISPIRRHPNPLQIPLPPSRV